MDSSFMANDSCSAYKWYSCKVFCEVVWFMMHPGGILMVYFVNFDEYLSNAMAKVA